jgi:hypothetical protein
LHSSGSECGECSLKALMQPMPILFRDLDTYGDGWFFFLGNRRRDREGQREGIGGRGGGC